MKNYKQQIQEYKNVIEEKYVRIEAENRTVMPWFITNSCYIRESTFLPFDNSVNST